MSDTPVQAHSVFSGLSLAAGYAHSPFQSGIAALRDPGRLRESAMKHLWFSTAIVSVLAILLIIVFLIIDAYPIFAAVGVYDFIAGRVWDPAGAAPAYGILPLIAGTLLVTFGAMVFAIPLGIGSAVFLAELAPPQVRAVAKPAIELLAGIPSVVYGFFGLIVLTNWLRITFDIASGETWLAASLLLGIMALPTIVSVSDDAIRAVPRSYREGSFAVGATHWQTIRSVVLPAAISGITAAIILGMGRAIGETMAVIMVAGNAAIIPDPITNALSPVRTLTGTLGIEMGEAAVGSAHYHALFGVAVVLLAITLAVNMCARMILQRIQERHEGAAGAGYGPIRAGIDLIRLYTPIFLLIVPSGLLAVAADLRTAALALAVVLGFFLLRERVSPKISQKIAFGLITSSALIVLLILGIILFDIISNGLPALSWEFLTEPPRNLGREGGIGPAILGTLYLIGGAILVALPIGIGAAIYLNEYTTEGRVTRTIRAGADLLNGTPSIVFGLFGFAFLVLFLNLGVSLLAGQITLGLMILPTIIRTTEEALKAIPDSLREGSLALGATRWQTISRVILPSAVPGILTGTILSIGRAAGETAPILFTAVVFSRRLLPTSVFEPVMALPYHLFILATNVPGAERNQYGTALVLLMLVVGVYLTAILIRNRYQKTVTW
ncbi:MAG: phosphate ABC transporter permease PstA [Methanomicrobiaceae archaeon]|nr:phosphate ABC transporter permease PstA [Methanomicrobiaceae archaeon]